MKELRTVRFWLGLVIAILIARPALASDMVLVSGEKLIGVVILDRGIDSFVVQHPILGRLTIATSDIRTIDDKPIEAILIPTRMIPANPALPAPTPSKDTTTDQEDSNRASSPDTPRVHWASQLEFGGNITDGPTDTGNLVIRFRTTKTTPGNVTRADMNYRLSTNNGDRTVDRFDVGFFTEWNDEISKWSTFGQGRYERAEFDTWDERLTGSGGLGYRFLELKEVDETGNPVEFLKLIGRVGGGLRQEFGSDNEDLAPEGLVGLDMNLRLSEDQHLLGITRYFPDLNESGEFRVESALDWSIAIDKLKGVSLRLGLQHEYDSQSASDISKNDISAQATLVISF
ncbi:MAG: DUF481 domain-containing protein [Planctomycetota bacterium]|nr:DUF481 domain-containing protein [Planctomycetota bacterium]